MRTPAVRVTIQWPCAILCLWVGLLLLPVGRAHGDPRRDAERLQREAEPLRRTGHYRQAIPLAERALALLESAQPPDRLSVAAALSQLANLLAKQGDAERAVALCKRALALREAALGPQHLDVAASLYQLARAYLDDRGEKEAAPLLQRALSIRQAKLGPRHVLLAEPLLGLALVNDKTLGDAKNEAFFLRALRLREAALGPDHPDVAEVLEALGTFYHVGSASPRLADAERVYQRALRIDEAALGPDHPDVGMLLFDLAYLYGMQAMDARAEPLLLRAMAIWEASLGPEHPYLGMALGNLSTFYIRQGNYAQAESVLLRSLAVRESAEKPSLLDISFSVDKLCSIYRQRGDHTRAETYCLRALKIRETIFGPEKPVVGHSLRDLARLRAAQGRMDEAEGLYLRALKIFSARDGAPSEAAAQTLRLLAESYIQKGAYEKAESPLRRSLAISEGQTNRQETAKVLDDLGLLLLAQGRFEEARATLARAFAGHERYLREQFSSLSEPRLAAFLQTLRTQEEAIYTLLVQRPTDPEARHLALEVALLRKGRSVDELAAVSRAVHLGQSLADREQFERARKLKGQFASLSLAGPGALSPERFQQQLKGLEAQIDAVEEDLARRAHLLRSQRNLPDPERDGGPSHAVQQLAAALPPDGALVEIIEFSPLDLRRAPGPSPSRYLALVLHPDRQLDVADLGPAAVMDGEVARLRAALSNPAAAYQGAVSRLSRLLLSPLLPLLRGRRNLFLSLDGQLQFVPFAVLQDRDRALAEGYRLIYLTSARDLLREERRAPLRTTVAVLADPDFEAAPGAPAAAAATAPLSQASPRADRGLLLGARYQPLPGTRREAGYIGALFPGATLLLGADASEAALLQLPAPGILHVATHGKFLGDVERRVGVERSLLLEQSPPPPNPLLRSALVLAGASHWQRQPQGASGELGHSDGLATALEVSGMDLWGTQLVVLSACQTGQGEVRIGQGVYGLRRAVMVAGAETLVTSLWRVNDQATAELVSMFYRNLRAGQGRGEAMAQAAAAVRARFSHPYYWAPFIVIGRGDPLRGIGGQGSPR